MLFANFKNSKVGKLIALFLVLLLIVLAFLAYQFISNEQVLDPVITQEGIIESDAHLTQENLNSLASHRSDAEQTIDEIITPSTLSTNYSSISRQKITDTESVLAFIEDSANSFGWSEQQTASNLTIWSSPCDTAKNFANVVNADLSSSGIGAQFSQNAHLLSEFCADIALQSELASLDILSDLMNSVPDVATPAAVLGEDLLTREPTEQDLVDAIALILESIYMQDEASLNSLLALIFSYELYASSSLDNVEFRYIGLQIVNDVAISLLCTYSDGCTGYSHPILLRYCFQKYQLGQLCSNPASVQDAIFQTTSPVFYYWYVQYLNYIKTELIRTSR